MFYFENINGKRILKSDLIKGAEAFFTTRDICIKSGAENMEKEVKNNKKIVAEYLKIPENNLISPNQTHSANIDIAIETRHDYPQTDALILESKNLGIFLNFADCTPVILYDKTQNIGAIAHAGWRGTVQKIAPKTVQKMVALFGSKPENLQAVIGPAIGFCCYNVGEEVFEQLKQTINNFGGLSEVRDGNIFVDLKKINKQQLLEIGVEEIDVCPYCTVHNNDIFFSYRNENATPNRHSTVLKLGE